MEKMLLMRALRLRYKISLDELAQAAGVPHQLVSDIELGKQPATPGNRRLAARAFENAIQKRKEQIGRLAEDYSAGRFLLLDETEETN